MIIGVVHALAGGAVFALLDLPIIREPAWAMAYVAIFGVGTISGMMLIAAAIAVPIAYAAERFEVSLHWIGLSDSALSFLVRRLSRLPNRLRSRTLQELRSV